MSVSQCQRCHPVAYTLGQGKSNPRDCICPKRYYWGLTADNVATCYRCPVGAACTDATCFIARNEENCTVDGPIVGTWGRDDLEMFYVTSCPAGHMLVNSTVGTSSGVFDHDVQQCKPCATDSEYVINPNTDICQPCPIGLICDGTANYVNVVPGAEWEDEDGVYKLRSCPTGYRLYALSNVLQECQPCGLGEQCSLERCYVCSGCPAGMYKGSAGPQGCRSCPVNTYGPASGATSRAQCTQCPEFSYTAGVGHSSVQVCIVVASNYVVFTTRVLTLFSRSAEL